MPRDDKCFNPSDARACRQVIALALSAHGLHNKLTAKSAGFYDLARASRVFVKIEGSLPPGVEEEMVALARGYGFSLSVPQVFA
jgi:hypothetical protein